MKLINIESVRKIDTHQSGGGSAHPTPFERQREKMPESKEKKKQF